MQDIIEEYAEKRAQKAVAKAEREKSFVFKKEGIGEGKTKFDKSRLC